MLKVFVFGGNGMLGRYICEYLEKNGSIAVTRLSRDDFDAEKDSLEELEKIICKGCVVVNAVGKIPQVNPDSSSYYRVNAVFPMMLDVLCKKYNVRLIHATTDCVFDGKKGKYTEFDKCNVQTDYGRSKWFGEEIDATIIRTSIIGETERGISLMEWVKSNKNGRVVGYSNHYWNGITCLQYAKIVEEIILGRLYWKGVRHIFSPNIVSKAELVNLINNQYNLNIDIEVKDVEYCDRSLSSIFEPLFEIPELDVQIKEQAFFRFSSIR